MSPSCCFAEARASCAHEWIPQPDGREICWKCGAARRPHARLRAVLLIAAALTVATLLSSCAVGRAAWGAAYRARGGWYDPELRTANREPRTAPH